MNRCATDFVDENGKDEHLRKEDGWRDTVVDADADCNGGGGARGG
jgi:hypothetical protein